jgi:hypothetical protein
MQKVTEAASSALQAVIGEFKNISPEFNRALVFKKNGEVLTCDENIITESQVKKIAAAFNEIAVQAEVIGGVETLAIQGVGSKLTMAFANNRYVATVSSRAADEKMVKALTCVIVPTVIRLLDQIAPASPDNQPGNAAEPEFKGVEEVVQPPEEPTFMEQTLDAAASEADFRKPPVNQFMVEKIGGLLVASDVVRVDADLVAKWRDLYGDKELTQVRVETLEGKAVICRFKPMKEAEGNQKGVIQIPEKILEMLRTGEGKLVMVRPEIPTEKEKKR